VYDVTNETSVDNLGEWLGFFAAQIELDMNHTTFPFIVIGNKMDLFTDDHVHIVERAKLFCNRNNFLHYEASAKEGDNVEKVFQKASELIKSNNSKLISQHNGEDGSDPPVKIQALATTKKSTCCSN
jgi:GTPase SAR1 family protein